MNLNISFKNRLKKIFLCGGIVCLGGMLSFFSFPVEAKEQRIGFVNMIRVSAEVQSIASVHSKLKIDYDTKKLEFDKKNEAIQAEFKNLEKAVLKKAIKEAAAQKKGAELRAEMMALQNHSQRWQETFMMEQQISLKPLYARIKQVSGMLARSKSVSLVLAKPGDEEESFFLYYDPELDLTNEVIKELQKQDAAVKPPSNKGG